MRLRALLRDLLSLENKGNVQEETLVKRGH